MHTWTMILILAACVCSFLIGRIYQQFSQFQQDLEEDYDYPESLHDHESLQPENKE